MHEKTQINKIAIQKKQSKTIQKYSKFIEAREMIQYGMTHCIIQYYILIMYSSPISTLFSNIFRSAKQQQHNRIPINRDELLEFWDSMSLIEKQKLLYIDNWSILQYISMHICYFISNKKFKEEYPCYRIKTNTQYLLSIYDCIVFRMIALEKQERELISSFLLIFRDSSTPINIKVHEVISNDVLNTNVIKVKASYIIRVISFFEKYLKLSYFDGQKYILGNQHYEKALGLWLGRKFYKDNFDLIRDLFLFVLVILQNQIVRSFVSTLSFEEIQRRRYKEPIRIFQRPKVISLSTSTMNDILSWQIDWNSLRVELYKIKYRIRSDGNSYLCYKIPEDYDSDNGNDICNQEDWNIAQAFRMVKSYSKEEQ